MEQAGEDDQLDSDDDSSDNAEFCACRGTCGQVELCACASAGRLCDPSSCYCCVLQSDQLCVNIGTQLPYYPAHSADALPETPQFVLNGSSSLLKVASWNLRSFGSNVFLPTTDRTSPRLSRQFLAAIDQVSAFLRHYDVDLLFIQDAIDHEALKQLVAHINKTGTITYRVDWISIGVNESEEEKCDDLAVVVYKDSRSNALPWRVARSANENPLQVYDFPIEGMHEAITEQRDRFQSHPAFVPIVMGAETVCFVVLKLTSDGRLQSLRLNKEIEALPGLAARLKETTGADHVVLLGDFERDPNTVAFSGLTRSGHFPALKSGKTIYQDPTRAPGRSMQSHLYDNFWLPRALEGRASAAVGDEHWMQLEHGGFQLGGSISDHLPVLLALVMPSAKPHTELQAIRTASPTRGAFFAAIRARLIADEEPGAEVTDIKGLLEIFASALGLSQGEDELVSDDALVGVLSESQCSDSLTLLQALKAVKSRMFELVLFEALSVESRPLRRSRLMVVGEGAAGKTSFVRALTSQAFEDKWRSTVGLKATEYLAQRDDNIAVREAGVEMTDFSSSGSSWSLMEREPCEVDRTLRGELLRCARQARVQDSRKSLAERAIVMGASGDGGTDASADGGAHDNSLNKIVTVPTIMSACLGEFVGADMLFLRSDAVMHLVCSFLPFRDVTSLLKVHASSSKMRDETYNGIFKRDLSKRLDAVEVDLDKLFQGAAPGEIVLAGSTTVQVMLSVVWPGSDVDVYVTWDNAPKARANIRKLGFRFTKRTTDPFSEVAAGSDFDSDRKGSVARMKVETWTREIAATDDDSSPPCKVNIDLVIGFMPFHRDAWSVIDEFDLDICKTTFDGHTWGWVRDSSKVTSPLLGSSRSIPVESMSEARLKRLDKYRARGITVVPRELRDAWESPESSEAIDCQGRELAVRALGAVTTERYEEESANPLGDFSLNFESGEAEALAFSVWDYGGQRVFQTVQHLFLSRYGVYVLAFDLTKLRGGSAESAVTKGSLEYLRFWLQQIGMSALGAPLVLLGTHLDTLDGAGRGELGLAAIHEMLLREFSAEPAWATLHNNAEQHLCFFPVTNRAADRNIVRLRALIEELAENDRIKADDAQSYVNSSIPLSWLRLVDELKRREREEGESHLSRREVDAVAQACGVYAHLAISDLTERKILLSKLLVHLTTLGIVVYMEEAGLDDVVILNPQWLLDCIVCVVRDFGLHPLSRDRWIPWKELVALREQGVLAESALRIFWSEETDSINFLKSFLFKIGVMCELPQRREKTGREFLIPAAILSGTDGEEAGSDFQKFSPKLCAGLVCEITVSFPRFLPQGLIERLVVALAAGAEGYSRFTVASQDLNRSMFAAPCLFLDGRVLIGAVPAKLSGAVVLLSSPSSGEGSALHALLLVDQQSTDSAMISESELSAAVAVEVERLKAALTSVMERFYYTSAPPQVSVVMAPAVAASRRSPSNEMRGPSLTSLESVMSEATTREARSEESEEGATDNGDAEGDKEEEARAVRDLSAWLKANQKIVKHKKHIDDMALNIVREDFESSEALVMTARQGYLPQSTTDMWFVQQKYKAALRSALEKALEDGGGGNALDVLSPASQQQSHQDQDPAAATDAFISYAWGNKKTKRGGITHYPDHEFVCAINTALRRRGLITWFDSNTDTPHHLRGSMDATMAAGIENTQCFVPIITDIYRRKVNGADQGDNCWGEFSYALRRVRGQKMVVAVIERTMTSPHDWGGTLGLRLGGNKFIDVSSPRQRIAGSPEFEAAMDGLKSAIVKNIQDNKGEACNDASHSLPPLAPRPTRPIVKSEGCGCQLL